MNNESGCQRNKLPVAGGGESAFLGICRLHASQRRRLLQHETQQPREDSGHRPRGIPRVGMIVWKKEREGLNGAP